ncbi:MAG: VOC family protein [Chloroflexi bacterium]|nr:VOC family protein [Chloroflexota bacterium]
MFNGIDHIEIVPRDLERTLAFYVDILGFRIKDRRKVEEPNRDEIIFLELNDTYIELMPVYHPIVASEERWQIGCRGIGIAVDDMEKAVEYLLSKGVEMTLAPVTSSTWTRARFNDPNGLSVELRQQLEPW